MSVSIYSVDDAQRLAKVRLPKLIFDFVEGASGDETLRDLNTTALDRIRLMPRVLIDVSSRNLAHNFLGKEYGVPFGIAPMGMCNLICPAADVALATEASKRRLPVAVSTASSTTLEKMIELAQGYAWFQLYADQSQEFVMELIKRAKVANYDFLVLTVDVPIPSRRVRDLRNGFSYPFKWTLKKALHFAKCPTWTAKMIFSSLREGIPRPANYASSKTQQEFDRNAPRTGANWEFLQSLRDNWKGKLIVKGVQCPKDAIQIKSLGIDAIYVSNHGGRQLNAAPTAVDALENIRKAVGDNYPLIYDGGIRSGEHILKAIAAGANFTMLGRSAMYALGGGGKNGINSILDCFNAELDTAMGLTGCCSPNEIGNNCLAKPLVSEA